MEKTMKSQESSPREKQTPQNDQSTLEPQSVLPADKDIDYSDAPPLTSLSQNALRGPYRESLRILRQRGLLPKH